MSALAVLQAERALLSDPKRLCRGAFARDKWGHRVQPRARSAVSWCLIGAVIVDTGPDDDREQAARLLDVVASDNGHLNAQLANDGLDHAGVMALLDEAIARVTAAGGVS